jgi:hypothetical protein
VWMPLHEAVERAGTLEALLPYLREGSILARHKGIYTWPGGHEWTGPGNMSPGLWTDARYDPAIGRLILTTITFSRDDIAPFTRKFFATGIELERGRVETLFPVKVAAVSAPLHAYGGRRPDHDWEGAARHVDHSVATCGPLSRKKDGTPNAAGAVALMTEWFNKNDPPAPKDRSIRRWISKNPRSWWGPN